MIIAATEAELEQALCETYQQNYGADAYLKGHEDGYADGCLIGENPAGTNGHTYERYIEIRKKYEEAIYTAAPTDYQRGYADGFDERSEEIAAAREDQATEEGTPSD